MSAYLQYKVVCNRQTVQAADGGTCSPATQGRAEPEAHLGGKKIRQAALTFIMKLVTVPGAGCRQPGCLSQS